MESYPLYMDNIMEIALVSDYETTVKLLDSYPQINTKDFWRNKCNKQYPEKLYIDTWSGKENYLVQSKNDFCVNIKCSSNMNIDHQLYEYDEILEDILSSMNENVRCGGGYGKNTLVKVNINNGKYILIIENFINNIQYIDNYKFQLEAMDVIIGKRLILSQNADHENGYFKAVIINIENMMPRFFGMKKLRDRTKIPVGSDYYQFYGCTYDNIKLY